MMVDGFASHFAKAPAVELWKYCQIPIPMLPIGCWELELDTMATFNASMRES